MATIKTIKNKKGVRYRVQIRMRNYPERCATFDRLSEARAWASRLESDMRSGKYSEMGCEHIYLVQEMLDRYMETVLPFKTTKQSFITSQRQQLLWWRVQIGKYRLSKLTHVVIAEKLELLRQKGLSHATMNRYRAALSHVLSLARKQWGWMSRNPLDRVASMKEPRGRVRFLQPHEKERLYEACAQEKKYPLYEIVMLALSTGARKSEILNIKREDIDIERRFIAIHDTKNHESRRLALSDDMVIMVRDYMQRNNNSIVPYVYLFEYRRTRKPYLIDDAWYRARTRAGLQDFRFHDLRHSFASFMAMQGASLPVLSEALGHKKLDMVKKYAHLSESHTSVIINEMCNNFIFDKNYAAQAQQRMT